jgi:hypothetical protein
MTCVHPGVCPEHRVMAERVRVLEEALRTVAHLDERATRDDADGYLSNAGHVARKALSGEEASQGAPLLKLYENGDVALMECERCSREGDVIEKLREAAEEACRYSRPSEAAMHKLRRVLNDLQEQSTGEEG